MWMRYWFLYIGNDRDGRLPWRGRWVRQFVAGVLVFLGLWFPVVSVAQELTVPQAVLDSLNQTDSARVIIGLKMRTLTEGTLSSPTAVASQRESIAYLQAQFLNQLNEDVWGLSGIGGIASDMMGRFAIKAEVSFQTIPYLAMTVDSWVLTHIQNNPYISSIEEDRIVPPTLSESVPLIGADLAWTEGYTGAGQAVAVLDTGVDKGHSFFTGKVIAEACYSTTDFMNGSTTVCPNGSRQQIGIGAGVSCDSGISGCAHGTHVAGIAAGNGSLKGVAKDANIIAIQVFSRFNSSSSCGTRPAPCALSYTSDQNSGLEEVLTLHQSGIKIAAVNVSIGGGKYFTACDSKNYSTKAAIDNLRSVGIATVISSGNDGYTDSIGSPACISSAVSVGATDKTDNVASYSNSASMLKVLAPGSSITSSVPADGTAAWNGTSMAAPHVAGAWAVLKSAVPNATVSQALNCLTTTGQSIYDSRNGITKPRIKVDAAITCLVPPPTLEVAPTSYNFGNVTVGSFSTAQTITLSNTGGKDLVLATINLVNAIDFVLNDTCSNTTLVPKQTCSIRVVFGPQSAGTKATTLSIPSNDPNRSTVTVSLTGNGVALIPNIEVTPTSRNFGNVSVDTTTTIQTFIVSNTGNTNLSLGTLSWTGTPGEFLATNGCTNGLTLAPAVACSITVAFQPQSPGAKSATFSLASNDPDTSNLLVTVTGNGVFPNIQVTPTIVHFGNVKVGATSTTQVVTVSNMGDGNLSIQPLTLSANTEFAFVSNGCSGITLAPNGTCSVAIRFQPTTANTQSGSLSIPSNDPDTSNWSVTLTGKGIIVPSLGCESPATGTALTPTIVSIQDGSWTDINTWDVGDRYPNLSSDVVLVNNHIITDLPAKITIDTLCNHGTLSSRTDSSLEIQAKGGFYNYASGIIKGEDGANDPTSSACHIGKDVTLKAAAGVQSHDKYGDLWYYTHRSTSPIVNDGKILGGAGQDGTSCGGKGGNVTVLGHGITNHSLAEIKAGNGGTASAGKGGEGGRAQVFGKLGGSGWGGAGFVNSQGSIVGGNGGNGSSVAGRGGNLWIVGIPKVQLGPDLTNTDGCMQCSTIDRIGHYAGTGGTPNGQNGWVQIEPSVISITAGEQAEINGSEVTIFGGDDWTLNLSDANSTVVEATDNITLAVGNNSVIDLRGNRSAILKAGGEVKIFSNQVLLDPGVTLSDIIEAPKITPAPSKILRNVMLSGSSQVAGQPGVTLPIRFTISNGGPQDDTYQVVTSNSTGWRSETTVAVQGLDSLDVELGVKLPSQIGDAKVITIVATSQSDPEATSSMEVRAVVTAEGEKGDVNLIGSGDTTTDSDGYLSITPICTPTPDVPMLGDWHCDWLVELSPDAPEAIAKDVQVTVTIPTGVTVQTATAEVGDLTSDSTQVRWTLHDLSTTGVNHATLSLAMKLTDMYLLAITQQATVTATNYPAQTARARTAILIDDSIKVDLALVIDITGSMRSEMDGLKAALEKFIATLDARQSPTVALVVFKDVATVKAFTKDLTMLLKIIDTLKADGGGTCHEASVEALAKVARHVKAGGQIWFATDASPYPDSDVPAVLDLLKTQNIRFHATVTGDCREVNSLNE